MKVWIIVSAEGCTVDPVKKSSKSLCISRKYINFAPQKVHTAYQAALLIVRLLKRKYGYYAYKFHAGAAAIGIIEL